MKFIYNSLEDTNYKKEVVLMIIRRFNTVYDVATMNQEFNKTTCVSKR
ncbi:MAG: hypothetical protein N4A50_08005 [Vallitalea sp.]|jgi:hypothetical protein|nr:hypothetical protein [Vallitalea sp.]